MADTGAELVTAQTDDLDLERVAVNLPGTDTERPNWRRRLRTPVPELLETETAAQVIARMRPGRLPPGT